MKGLNSVVLSLVIAVSLLFQVACSSSDPAISAVLTASEQVLDAQKNMRYIDSNYDGSEADLKKKLDLATDELSNKTEKYCSSLKKVKAATMVLKQLDDCKEAYKNVFNLYHENYLEVSKGLKESDSRAAYKTIMNNALTKITATFRELDMFTKPEISHWTDYEKISRVEDIKKELAHDYELIDSFNVMYRAKVAHDKVYDWTN